MIFKNHRTAILMAMICILAACGQPLSSSSGNYNDVEEDGTGWGDGEGAGGSYITIFASVGESTNVIETEHFIAAVSLGKPLEMSEYYSQSFDLNNGFDLSAPILAENAEE